MVEKLLRQYGRELQLTVGGTYVPVRGILQPVTGKTERLASIHREMVGTENPAQYLYIGPVEPLPDHMSLIIAGEKQYRVRTAEPIYGGTEPVYCWAVCVEKGVRDQWGTSV